MVKINFLLLHLKNETGQMLAQRALMAWTEATGIRFHKIQRLVGIRAGNEGYSIRQVKVN